jgi:hypothetical protein
MYILDRAKKANCLSALIRHKFPANMVENHLGAGAVGWHVFLYLSEKFKQ